MNNWKLAINMELDGELYYRQQAEINKDNSLNVVCIMLAEDEKKHAEILFNKMNEDPSQSKDTEMFWDTKNVFSGLGDIKVEGKDIPSQLEFYKLAREKETESINLYKEYLLKAEDSSEKALFEFLIMQEEYHYQVLDELALLLAKPEEWVENAEFGVREEY